MPINHRARHHKTAPSAWLLQHLQVAIRTLGQLCRQPLSTSLTVTVIGIAIALPCGLYVLVDNIRQASQQWNQASTISLYLEQQLSDIEATQILNRVQQQPGVAETTLMTKTQAMAEFRRLSGFGEALNLLDHNPLPAVILVQPTLNFQQAHKTAHLAAELQTWPGIDSAQLDLQWLHRFSAITETITRGVIILAALLGLAVILIIGNTIRLHIQHRQAEINIVQQVGGTHAFIRRPFLYEGIWYGLFGAGLAYGLIFTAISLLDGPVQTLAQLYHSQFDISSFDRSALIALGCGSPLLGLMGAWIAVRQHLAKSL